MSYVERRITELEKRCTNAEEKLEKLERQLHNLTQLQGYNAAPACTPKSPYPIPQPSPGGSTGSTP